MGFNVKEVYRVELSVRLHYDCLVMFIICVRFSFSVLSQQIDWEERLPNDLFYVGWDVKP